MITPEQLAEIRRLYFGEHWKVGTIDVPHGMVNHLMRVLPGQAIVGEQIVSLAT